MVISTLLFFDCKAVDQKNKLQTHSEACLKDIIEQSLVQAAAFENLDKDAGAKDDMNDAMALHESMMMLHKIEADRNLPGSISLV